MILVVFGATKDVADEFIDELMLTFPAKVQRLCADHIPGPRAAMDYLNRYMTDYIKRSLTLTAIPHVSTAAELDFLLSHGAYVAHVYGPLSQQHSFIKISKDDLIVRMSKQLAPRHVLSSSELLSELMFRHRSLHRSSTPSYPRTQKIS